MRWATFAAIVAFPSAVAVAEPLTPAETRIAGRTYLFTPDMYQGGIVETGRIGDMLLELAWPEMRGLNPRERAMWPPRPTLLILANSAAQTAGDAVPVDDLIAGVRDELGIAISLYSDKDRVPRPADDMPQGAVPGSGMVKIAKAADPPGDVGSDVYALPPIKGTNEFIRCTRTDNVFTKSSCSQYFVAEHLLLKVTYDHAFVSDWRSVHDQVDKFLLAREVK